MTIQSTVSSQIPAKLGGEAFVRQSSRPAWRRERLEDLVALAASVAVFAGIYLLVSEILLPTLARGFASMAPGIYY